jgi:hypothetical protein
MGRRDDTQLERREHATRLAADLIRAHHDDPEAWVRLLMSAGIGDETTYHFDAYWPTWGQQSRVIVQRERDGRWNASFAEEPPAIAPTR